MTGCQTAVSTTTPTKIRKHWAQSFGKLYGTVYLAESSDGGLFSITHIQHPEQQASLPPVIMLPGMFTNRNFWCSPKGIGLAAYMAELGYDIWLIERRGLGETRGMPNSRSGLNECAVIDLPAAQQFIWQKNPQPAFWMGHSFGGVVIAAAIAEQHIHQSKVAGLITFGSQLTVGKLGLNPPVSWLTPIICKLVGQFPARAFKMGPENEPTEAILDAASWVSSAKQRGDFRYWKNFSSIQVPVLSISSDADKVDPWQGCKVLFDKMGSENKRWWLLGKRQQNEFDYDHPGMVISKSAQKEVWPEVVAWLEAN